MTEIPQFPDSLPSNGDRDWTARLQGQLFDQRIVVFSGRLDDLAAGTIAAQFMALDALGDGAITLRLSSGGGTLDAAMSVMDVIDTLGVPVHASAIGLLEGPAVGVLSISARRAAARHARLRLSDEPVTFEGTAGSIESWAANRVACVEAFAERIADRSRHTASEVLHDLGSGRYLSAAEAKEYGLIDEIASPDAAILDLHRSDGRGSLGFRPSGV